MIFAFILKYVDPSLSTSVLLYRGYKITLTAISTQFTLLSGQFPKSPGRPCNRGPTVYNSRKDQEFVPLLRVIKFIQQADLNV